MGFGLAERRGRYLTIGGKFYPCCLLEKGTSAAVEHLSKAGDTSWDTAWCQGQKTGCLASWQHPF